MKRSELFVLLKSLNELDDLTGVKFNFVINKNRNLLEHETEDIKKSSKPSEKFQEFEQKRIELIREYSEKDEQGNIKFEDIDGGSKFTIPEKDKKKFQKELSDLSKGYDDVIQERNEQLKEYNKFLQEEVDLQFTTFKLEDISDQITGKQFRIISPFIQE